MSSDINIMKELAVFNSITYYDEPHKYYIDEEQMISTTTLLHKYKREFKTDLIAPKSGKKWQDAYEGSITFSPAFVKDVWSWLNLHAVTEGSTLHDYLENKFNNKVFPYPKQKIIDIFGYDAIKETYPTLKEYADNFYKDTLGKLIPIRAELVMGDPELKLCGMADMLFWNEKEQQYQIWDWKTNTKLNKSSKYGQSLTGILSHLSDCELTLYSLQLSTYRFIVEKNTSIKLGDSYIVWFNEENSNYEVIKCHDFRKEIKEVIRDYNKNPLIV